MKLQLNQNSFTIEKIPKKASSQGFDFFSIFQPFYFTRQMAILNQKIFISFSTLMFKDIHRTSHICPNMVDAAVPEISNLM